MACHLRAASKSPFSAQAAANTLKNLHIPSAVQLVGPIGVFKSLLSVTETSVGAGCLEPRQTIIDAGIVAIKLDRFVVVVNNSLVLPLGVPGAASIEIGQRIVGIEPDRFVTVADGSVVFSLAAPGKTSIHIGEGTVLGQA